MLPYSLHKMNHPENIMINPDENPFSIYGMKYIYLPFFTVEVTQKDDVSSIYICPQSVKDLCGFIEKYTSDNLVIFGVDPEEFDEFTKDFVPLEVLASNAEIQYSAIDSETIVLSKDYLLPFLSTFDHWNLRLFDIKNGWNEYQVISQVLAYRERRWQPQDSVLPKLAESQLFLYSHDDCYLYIESYSTDFSKDIFIRNLQIYTSAFLANSGINLSKLSDFPQDLLNLFWKDSFGLTILDKLTKIEGDYLIIGVSKQTWILGENVGHTPEFWIMYDIQDQKWLVQI